MNIALTLASGTGQWMRQEIPKQFINVNNKPLIIYTLGAFQKHPQVDNILAVCIDGWHDILKSYAKQSRITKIYWVTSGGNTDQESIRNGVYHLEDICSSDDIVIIHDGIRPLVDETILPDVIVKCELYGNTVTSPPYNEQIFTRADEFTIRNYIPRDTLRCVSTPQAYKYGKLLWAYYEAFEKQVGILGVSYTNTMMTDLGETLYLTVGSDKNIKITTPEDLELFKALLETKSKH